MMTHQPPTTTDYDAILTDLEQYGTALGDLAAELAYALAVADTAAVARYTRRIALIGRRLTTAAALLDAGGTR